MGMRLYNVNHFHAELSQWDLDSLLSYPAALHVLMVPCRLDAYLLLWINAISDILYLGHNVSVPLDIIM